MDAQWLAVVSHCDKVLIDGTIDELFDYFFNGTCKALIVDWCGEEDSIIDITAELIPEAPGWLASGLMSEMTTTSTLFARGFGIGFHSRHLFETATSPSAS